MLDLDFTTLYHRARRERAEAIHRYLVLPVLRFFRRLFRRPAVKTIGEVLRRASA